MATKYARKTDVEKDICEALNMAADEGVEIVLGGGNDSCVYLFAAKSDSVPTNAGSLQTGYSDDSYRIFVTGSPQATRYDLSWDLLPKGKLYHFWHDQNFWATGMADQKEFKEMAAAIVARLK